MGIHRATISHRTRQRRRTVQNVAFPIQCWLNTGDIGSQLPLNLQHTRRPRSRIRPPQQQRHSRNIIPLHTRKNQHPHSPSLTSLSRHRSQSLFQLTLLRTFKPHTRHNIIITQNICNRSIRTPRIKINHTPPKRQRHRPHKQWPRRIRRQTNTINRRINTPHRHATPSTRLVTSGTNHPRNRVSHKHDSIN